MRAERVVGAVMLVAGLASCEEGIRYTEFTVPAQEQKIVTDTINRVSAQYDKPTQADIDEANRRALSNMCGDRPCTPQERQDAITLFDRNTRIEATISNQVAAAKQEVKSNSYTGLAGLATGAGFLLGLFGVYFAFNNDSPSSWKPKSDSQPISPYGGGGMTPAAWLRIQRHS